MQNCFHTSGDDSHLPRSEQGFSSNSVFIWRRQWQAHSSTLAWRIPWTEEPGRLQSMGSLRDGHDWVTSLLPFNFMHWRKKWQPTPVFLPEESQGQGSLVGCRLHRIGHNWSDLAAAAVVSQHHLGSCSKHGLSSSNVDQLNQKP